VIHGRRSTAHSCDAGFVLHQTRKLNKIEGFVLMHVNVLLEPAVPAQGIFAFAASIGEGHTRGASGTDFYFALVFALVDDTPDYDYGLLVTRLMLEATRNTIWQSTVAALSEQGTRLDSLHRQRGPVLRARVEESTHQFDSRSKLC
jgi:hypothetical protein